MSQLSIFSPFLRPVLLRHPSPQQCSVEYPELLAHVTGLLLETSQLREELPEEMILSRQLASHLLEYHHREQKRENGSYLPSAVPDGQP